MKKLAVFGLFAALSTVSAFAGEWTGVISDAKCGKAHAEKLNEACVKGCVGKGSEAVFVTADGKVLKIHNQDAVKDHLGHKVTITGKVEGESVHVDSVKM